MNERHDYCRKLAKETIGRTDAGPLAVVNLIQGRSATGTSQQQR
jgi:hypothetical protein